MKSMMIVLVAMAVLVSCGWIVSANDNKVPNRSVEATAEKSGQPRYMYWDNQVDDILTYSDIALRITPDDMCTISLVMRTSRLMYTYTRNRVEWTGPYISLVLYDKGRVPIEKEWRIGQVNFLYGEKEKRIIEMKKIVGAYKLAFSSVFIHSAYRYFWP